MSNIDLEVRAANSMQVSRARRRSASIARRRHRVKCAVLTPPAIAGVVIVANACTSTTPPTVASTCLLGFGFVLIIAWLAALIEA